MTTQKLHINVCPTCDLEFVGHQCAPCPQCPMIPALEATRVEVENSQPFKLLTETCADTFEYQLNALMADGWDLDKFYTCQTHERDEGWPVLVGLMRRPDYDQARHSEAAATHRTNVKAHQAMMLRVESEIDSLKAARSEAA